MAMHALERALGTVGTLWFPPGPAHLSAPHSRPPRYRVRP